MTSEKEDQLLKERIKIPGRKTYDEVFDKSTLKVLYGLMTDGVIDYVDHPISTGKESKVFKAYTSDGERVVLKIMRINTATFKEYRKYIEGDYRFKNYGKGRKLVFTWTKKEFSNLKKSYEGGINVPKPITFSKNVLVMEFLNYDDEPAPMLKNVELDNEDAEILFDTIIDMYKKMVSEVKLVHGDLSEYNILISEGYPYFIDISQGVPISHPKALEFLRRDLKNIIKYFKNYNLDIDEDEIMDRFIGSEGE